MAACGHAVHVDHQVVVAGVVARGAGVAANVVLAHPVHALYDVLGLLAADLLAVASFQKLSQSLWLLICSSSWVVRW